MLNCSSEVTLLHLQVKYSIISYLKFINFNAITSFSVFVESHSSLSVNLKIDLTMTNNSYQVNFQYGDLDESHNFSNLLRIVVNLIPPKRNEGQLHPSLVILYIILLIILETFGNFLLFCMICYEKNGMDSKKRTITNMLLSRMIFVQILCNIFIMPVLTISEIRIFGVYCKYLICRKFLHFFEPKIFGL